MQQILIKFPEIRLHAREAHKLRGYFARLFKERSSLLHNHLEDGTSIYRYPLVQYKVVDNTPVLLGIEEGARLLLSLFREIKELDIGGRKYKIFNKDMCSEKNETGVVDDLYEYTFKTPWMALNQKIYAAYLRANAEEKTKLLQRILTSNIITFFKAIEHQEAKRILVKPKLWQVNVRFKDQSMNGFKGTFMTNVLLPDYLGLGKSVSRGFGTLLNKK